MRSTEQSHVRTDFEIADSQPQPVTNKDALRIRQIELLQSHHDMDDAVARLSDTGTCDELLLARLKKRKLQIKDEIARVEAVIGLKPFAPGPLCDQAISIVTDDNEAGDSGKG